jgi:hypothetical protein
MRACLVVCFALLLASPVLGDVPFGDESTVVFATAEQGRELLARRDDYISRLSPLDLAVRLRTAGDVDVEDYLAVVKASVVEWSAEEKDRLTKMLTAMQERGRRYARALPTRVLLIKTNGSDESGAAYTRADAVVLPQGRLGADDAEVEKLLWHEFFHVLSRDNPALRDELYALIGFTKCGEVALPADVADRKITNPDAPHHEHSLQIKVDGAPRPATPILLSTRGREQAGEGGSFFQFIEVHLLVLDPDAKDGALRALVQDGKARLIPLKDAPDFFSQIGGNTGYIIHPEEIVADNFALAAMETTDVPNPELLAKVRDVLTAEVPATSK